MKRFYLFWKIVLIIFAVSFAGIFSIQCWKMFDRRYGVSSRNTILSETCKGISYNDGRIKIFNKLTGEVTTPKLDLITNHGKDNLISVFLKDGKRGYVDLKSGKIIFKEIYECAWLFSEGLGAVVKNSKLGFINIKGEVVIPFRFNYFEGRNKAVDFIFNEGYCTAIDSLGKHGLINKKGEWVIPPTYDYINNPVIGYRIIKLQNKYGLIDNKLKWTLPIEYDNIAIEKDGFVVMKDGGQKLISFDTKKVIRPFVYDEIVALQYNSGRKDQQGEDIFLECNCFVYRIKDKWGILDKYGKVVLKALYSNIEGLSNNLYSCETGDKWITINAKGQIL